MLAPRIARWVEVRGRLGENVVNEGATLSPSLPLISTLRRRGRIVVLDEPSMLVFLRVVFETSCLRVESVFFASSLIASQRVTA